MPDEVIKPKKAPVDWSNGVIYLVHFSKKYKHAGHYLGFASNLEARLKRHREGRGSNLLKVIQDAGIDWEVVRTWGPPASPKVEAELKRYRNNRALCPLCNRQYAMEKAENLREKRRLLRLERTGDS